MIAVGPLAAALLLTLKGLMMEQFKVQVDQSLNVIADAVETLRMHVEALQSAQGAASAEELARTVEWLKAGTDTLAAAVASAKHALAG
jgi:hypothetical protein